VWGTVLAVVPAFGLLFALRWVFFAVLVGYGMLRYQLFDLQAEGWRMLAYAVAVTAGIVVAAATVEATGGRRALDPVALAAGLAAALAIYLGLARLARPRPFAGPRELLLDIYENTLGHAVDPRHLTPGERRMVETLRDLFDVLPEEQERILERLARDPPLSAR
jgi:hypothetical protein